MSLFDHLEPSDPYALDRWKQMRDAEHDKHRFPRYYKQCVINYRRACNPSRSAPELAPGSTSAPLPR